MRILTTFLWGRFLDPHFVDGLTEAQRSDDLPIINQVRNRKYGERQFRVAPLLSDIHTNQWEKVVLGVSFDWAHLLSSVSINIPWRINSFSSLIQQRVNSQCLGSWENIFGEQDRLQVLGTQITEILNCWILQITWFQRTVWVLKMLLLCT